MAFVGNLSSRSVSASDLDLDEAYNELTPLVETPLTNSYFHSFDSLDHLQLEGEDDFGTGVTDSRIADVVGDFPAMLLHMDDDLVKYFSGQLPYNCVSYYADKPLDLDTLTLYCSPRGGYIVCTPNSSDRMWRSPKIGWQAIPNIWFLYGFRLPMHPFFLTMLEVFDCGVSGSVGSKHCSSN